MTNDRTLQAVERQLAAISAPRYEVGVLKKKLDADGKPALDAKGNTIEMMLLRGPWTQDQVIKAVPWLKRANYGGAHIYVRPHGDHEYSLVDDIKKPTIETMRSSGFQPAAVVETSPGNYQAWMKHGQVLPAKLSTEVAKSLAETLNGDPGSADWRHFGRLAGFTNRKEKYRTEAGMFPFSVLHESAGKVYDNAPAFVQVTREAHRQREATEQVRRAAYAQLTPRTGDLRSIKTVHDFHHDPRYGNDPSRADLAYAIYASSRNVPRGTIEAAIAARDLTKKGSEERQTAYIRRTVDKAEAQKKSPGNDRGR